MVENSNGRLSRWYHSCTYDGYIVATLDKFFEKKIPSVIKLLISPMLTVFISTFLLFTIVGPVGRELSNYITGGLVYISTEFGR